MITILQVLLGALVALATTICIEWLRKARLSLEIGDATDIEYENSTRPVQHPRWVNVSVTNRPVPRAFRWLSKNVALQCHGTITFHHLDGQNIFGRAMPIRWSSAPEPVAIPIQIGDQTGFMPNLDAMTMTPRIDIYPGETAAIAVAGRFDDDTDCYGWSNASYFCKRFWRNEDWRLIPGRYLVKVTVVSASDKAEGYFRLINDVEQRGDFRLEPLRPIDRKPY